MPSLAWPEGKRPLAHGFDKGDLVDLFQRGEPATHFIQCGLAQEAHAFIRKTLGEMSDDTTAEKIRIQYGGSVKPDNARELLSQPDIDGALVGGASLDPRSFAQIVQAGVPNEDV